jgi:hypothetical protein
MREITPSGLLASVLARLAEGGVVVDYMLFAPDGASASLDAVHRDAAASGMAVMDAHLTAINEERRCRWNRWRGRDPSDMSFYTERPAHRLLFDITKAAATEEPLEVFLKDYWHAFSDAPHGQQIVEPELSERFEEVNHLLFGDLSVWSIRRWSTDWSNYFNAGLEWWGAFLWTLVSPDRLRAVWVGASTTD